MNALDDPIDEAFAQGLALGLSLPEAARRAGIPEHKRGRLKAIAARKAIAKRIAQLRIRVEWGPLAGQKERFDRVMTWADQAAAVGAAPGFMAAKALMEFAIAIKRDAAAAQEDVASRAAQPVSAAQPLMPEFSTEQWKEIFGVKR